MNISNKLPFNNKTNANYTVKDKKALFNNSTPVQNNTFYNTLPYHQHQLIQGNQRDTWVYEEYPMSKAEGMDRDEIFQIHIAICKIYLIQRLEQTLGTISINTEITLE